MNYVIIGNSAAGITAAQEIRKEDKDASILIISQEKEASYSRCLLPDYLAGDLPKEQLFIRDPHFYQREGIKTLLGMKVIKIQPETKSLILEDQSQIRYDKLLLATGSKAVIPPLKGVDNITTFTLNSLEEGEKILNHANKLKKVLIIGGGFIGLELAFALRKRNKEVTVIEKMPRILSQQLDETAAAIMQKELEKSGIQLKLGTGVKEIVGNSRFLRFFGAKELKGVALEDDTFISGDMVVFAAGTRPNLEIIKDSALFTNRGIVVNEYLETNIPDIYAAGDVAETTDVITGAFSLSPIWPNAVIQGKYAGWNMVGLKRKFLPQVSMQNTSEFREIPFISVGIVNPPESKDYEIITHQDPHRGIYKKIVLQDQIPVGMIFLGDITNSGVVAGFIRARKKADQVKNLLVSERYSYARQLLPKTS